MPGEIIANCLGCGLSMEKVAIKSRNAILVYCPQCGERVRPKRDGDE